MQIPVVENVLKLNDEVAALNRQALTKAGIYTVNLIGSPGCGKTSLLQTTLARLHGRLEIAVLVGDLASTRDAARLVDHTSRIVQINTGRGCHLDANQVRQALAQLDLDGADLLIIENVGNLICPVGFDLGQDATVGMFSVTEGDDKAVKHPPLVHAADLIVLNKIDLLPYVSFDVDQFRQDVDRLSPHGRLVEVSATTNQIDPWLDWLTTRAPVTRPRRAHPSR